MSPTRLNRESWGAYSQRLLVVPLIALMLVLPALLHVGAVAADAAASTLTVTAVDADTGEPLAGADVSVYDLDGYYNSGFTNDAGTVDFTDVPATEVTITVDAYDDQGNYGSSSISVQVAPDTTTFATVPVEFPAPDEPGIYVSVYDDTFGGAVEGATVTLRDGDTAVDTATTDSEGQVFFSAAPGENYSAVATAPGFLPQESPSAVAFDGDYGYAQIYLTADLRCTPGAVNPSLTNMGFENGLDGWTKGRETESIQAVGADSFTSPWEGSSMLRLGDSQVDNQQTQRPGPNILCQDFVATQATERFSFNVFTYDYTGFDEFKFDLVVSDGASGDTLATYESGAFGEGIELKTSGWRGVSIDTSGYIGRNLHLTLRAGGTSDDLYAFWAYVDSADVLPPPVNVNTTVEAGSGSVTVDPETGQFTVAMPAGDVSDLNLRLTAACESGSTPESVSVLLDSVTYEASPVPDQAGFYSVSIPAAGVTNGTITLQVLCEGSTTISTPIGTVVLYDPSGIITDAATNEPVVGAEVSLHKVPGWSPRTDPSQTDPDTCETNESKAPGAPWNQPAPTDLGVLVNAASPEISPHVNPFLTSVIGYYGWDVAMGCWYVTVSAEGYDDLVSPVVGVPSEVTDLDLRLTPTAPPDTTPPDTLITTGPADGATVTQNSVDFEFTGDPSDDTASFECRLDDGAFAGCTTPLTLADLSNGRHTFAVRAIDAAGNIDATPAARSFTVEVASPPSSACTQAKADLAKAQGQVKAFTAKVAATKKQQAKAKAKLKKAKQSKADDPKRAKKIAKAQAKVKKAKARVKAAISSLKAAQGAAADAQTRINQHC